MLRLNTTLPTYPRTADADTGVVTIAGSNLFSLISSLDNGKTIRRSTDLGDVTIAHTQTSEYGGAYRHLLSVDLKPNGNIPGAKAQLVIVQPNVTLGTQRAKEAAVLLLNALVFLGADRSTVASDESLMLATAVTSAAAGNTAFIIKDVAVDKNAYVAISKTLDCLIGSEG